MGLQWSLLQLEAPEIDPVSVAEIKKHLRINHTKEDDVIAGCIKSAVASIDGATGFLGSCVVSQKWRFLQHGIAQNHCLLEIMLGNVKSVQQITMSKEGADIVVPAVDYELYKRNMFHAVRPAWGKVWPDHDFREASIKIDFTAGEPVTTDVDDNKSVNVSWAIKRAIFLTSIFYFNNRSDATPEKQHIIPSGSMILLSGHRIPVI